MKYKLLSDIELLEEIIHRADEAQLIVAEQIDRQGFAEDREWANNTILHMLRASAELGLDVLRMWEAPNAAKET